MKYIQHMITASKYSIKGIKYALKNENAARIELVAIIVAIVAANLIAQTLLQYIFMLGIVVLVFAMELINTAIEAIIDEADLHTELYGAAKDCGSAAVGVLALFGAFTWVSLFLENIVGFRLWGF